MVKHTCFRPSCHRFDSQRIFSDEKIVDVGGVNQWRCLEENEQRLKTVDRTHLVLASGKLVLQKKR